MVDIFMCGKIVGNEKEKFHKVEIKNYFDTLFNYNN